MRPSVVKPLFTSISAAGRKVDQIVSSSRLYATRTGRSASRASVAASTATG